MKWGSEEEKRSWSNHGDCPSGSTCEGRVSSRFIRGIGILGQGELTVQPSQLVVLIGLWGEGADRSWLGLPAVKIARRVTGLVHRIGSENVSEQGI